MQYEDNYAMSTSSLSSEQNTTVKSTNKTTIYPKNLLKREKRLLKNNNDTSNSMLSRSKIKSLMNTEAEVVNKLSQLSLKHTIHHSSQQKARSPY